MKELKLQELEQVSGGNWLYRLARSVALSNPGFGPSRYDGSFHG